ncbi:sterol carrier family protein [Mycobacterium intracellulare]|uniref:sterol carrier family protein n=1 Tax=Mycobacterium intracellulare TaxID=1767 RepID=UPI00109E3F31|nr:sterol carrier family protein [Mycobacterium intracellulare]
MAPRDKADPAKTRQAVLAVAQWLADETTPAPSRDELAAAVRLTARTLAAEAPGRSVELRIPPFAAVQCVAGPTHTRGTPPNVVETDPRTWLLLATGKLSFAEAKGAGTLRLSGSRAGEIDHCLPLFDVG